MNKKNRGYLIQILFLVILIALGLWRHMHRVYREVKQAFLMDTLFEIEAESANPNLVAILDSCFAIAENYEQQFSAYADSGEVRSLNDHSGTGIMTIDDNLVELLKAAEYFYKETEGRYDVSIGLLADLWDFSRQQVPDENQIREALLATGFDKVILYGNVITLPVGFKLNFGSIAKGYVVDKIRDILLSKGIDMMLINAGGDLFINSEKPLLIGIQHPRGEHGTVIDEISVKDMAVVTSGDYERYFEQDGERYHHIIDATTGYPARECVSVTAICKDAMMADALSTAAFLLKPEDAIKMADKIPDAAIIVYYFKYEELARMTSSRAGAFLVNN